MHLVLIGPPGSGKTTLAQALAEHFNMHHLSTGKLFRDIRKDDTRWTRQLQKIPNHAYVPDTLTNAIVHDYIESRGAIIFDGYPRTTEQHAYVEKHIPVTAYIVLELNEETARKRILARTDRPEADVLDERFADYAQHTVAMIQALQTPIVLDASHTSQMLFSIALKELRNFITQK